MRQPDIWECLRVLIQEESLATNVLLLGACLCEVKTNSVGETIETNKSLVWRSMSTCLQFAQLAEQSTNHPQTHFVVELDRTMAYH